MKYYFLVILLIVEWWRHYDVMIRIILVVGPFDNHLGHKTSKFFFEKISESNLLKLENLYFEYDHYNIWIVLRWTLEVWALRSHGVNRLYGDEP